MNILQYLHQEADKIFLHCPYDITDQVLGQKEKAHEWKNHIQENIAQVWSQLSEEARLVALIMAETQANNEEWE